MSDYVPSSSQNQELGARRSLYAPFYIAVALPGGVLVRVSRRLLAAVVRWVLPRYPRADPIREAPRRHIPGLLDPAQVEAVIAALRSAIARGAGSIPSLAQRRADSDSDLSAGSDDERGHPNDRHLWYPPIQSLEAGDARLFSVPCPIESVPGLPDDATPRRGDV